MFMRVNVFIRTHYIFQAKTFSEFFLMSWSFYFAIPGVSQGVILGVNVSLSSFSFAQMN